MEKFLSVVFVILIVLFVLKWVARLLMPWLLTLFAKHMMKKAGFQMPQEEEPQEEKNKKDRSWWGGGGNPDPLKPRMRDGESLSDVLGGEYVDYEEIKTDETK